MLTQIKESMNLKEFFPSFILVYCWLIIWSPIRSSSWGSFLGDPVLRKDEISQDCRAESEIDVQTTIIMDDRLTDSAIILKWPFFYAWYNGQKGQEINIFFKGGSRKIKYNKAWSLHQEADLKDEFVFSTAEQELNPSF